MVKINFHQHSTGSDGLLTPEQVVEEAIKSGITHICFTDHYPLPIGGKERESLKGKFEETYVKEVEKLKKEFSGKINIYFGAEFDWLEEYKDWTEKEIKKREYDFILGSVHYLPFDDNYLIVPFSETDLKEACDKFGNYKEIIKEYYKQIRLMINSGLFDCASHLDLIKMLNKDSVLFSEKEDWYKKEVLETLDEVKKAGMCIEINASGWRRLINEQYPSEWILIEAKKRNIPITIGTDGHKFVDTKLEEAFELARKVGYKSILIFENRKRKEIQI